MKRYYIENTPVKDAVLRRASLCLLLASLGKSMIWPLFSALAPGAAAESVSLAAELFYKVVMVAAPAVWCFRYKPSIRQALCLKPMSALHVILTAALAATCVPFSGAVSTLWARLLTSLGGQLSQTISLPASAKDAVSQLALYALLPGVCEELLFRGALLRAWEPYGARRSVLLSAILFMLFHESLQGAPVQLLMGMLLGDVVLSCDSLYAGMLFHTLFNALTLLGSWTELSNYAPECTFIHSLTGQGVLLLTSGLTIIVLKRALRKTCRHHNDPQHRSVPDGGARLLLAVCVLKMLMQGIEDALRLFGL